MVVLDEQRAALVRSLCELIVPGSGRVGPEVYIDAVLARMPDSARSGALASIDALREPAAAGAEGLVPYQFSPEFQFVRALACEAFYSDFVAPDAPGPGAWEEIDFAPPLAARLRKDWSYMGISG
jgi:hypothetical protein